MGERIENKCPEGQYWAIISEDGERACVPGPLGHPREHSFFGCNLDLARAAHEIKGDDDPYCAPCFTAEYTCVETGSEKQTRRLCPESELGEGRLKTKKEVFEEAARLLKNFNLGRSCTILNSYDYNHFKRWVGKITTQRLTRTAEYRCHTPTSVGRETAAENIVTKEIVIDFPGGADEETIRMAFEAAARKLEKTITGCYNVRFKGFQATTAAPQIKIKGKKMGDIGDTLPAKKSE